MCSGGSAMTERMKRGIKVLKVLLLKTKQHRKVCFCKSRKIFVSFMRFINLLVLYEAKR